MARTISAISGSRLTKLKQVYTPRAIRIKEETYQRVKSNSERYGDPENIDEILIRLLDYYENNNEPRYYYG